MADKQDSSLIHREMARKSQDIHRIKNPTDENFDLIWDSYVDTIPANGTADLPFYKVNKYLEEMASLIFKQRQREHIEKENERRRGRGEKEMDKWSGEAQHIMEGKFTLEHGIANPEARMALYKELYVGLIKEYGIDKVHKEKYESTASTHDGLMDQLLSAEPLESDAEVAPIEKTQDDTPQTPLEQMNQPQLRKVAKEKGISTEKTDKKDALIKLISKKQ